MLEKLTAVVKRGFADDLTSEQITIAVIEALMTPTPEMVSFGIDAMSRDDLEPTEDEFRAGFVAALRTASKPNEEGEWK